MLEDARIKAKLSFDLYLFVIVFLSWNAIVSCDIDML